MLDMVEAYVSRWKMNFNSRKSKVNVVGKREAGASLKIGEEIVAEVGEFKYLECGLIGSYKVMYS